MQGTQLIISTFESTRANSRAALMPYFTLGYPTPELALDVVAAIAGAGADLIELGLPFSDPLADGPTIQQSTQIALQNGMNLKRCLEGVVELRRRGVVQPLMLMGYYNPILAFGPERFVAEAASAGADGFIVPDLPYDEAAGMEAACRENGLALAYMLAPTSTPERIAGACQRTAGFLYLVSLTGVTGARTGLAAGLEEFIGRVRREADVPLAVGFGISTPEQARQVGRLADGVIVGSAVISAARGDRPVESVGAFVRSLAQALKVEPVVK
jgi:tryptophan synthase alpha chain